MIKKKQVQLHSTKTGKKTCGNVARFSFVSSRREKTDNCDFRNPKRNFFLTKGAGQQQLFYKELREGG